MHPACWTARRAIDALRERGELENTFIIFTVDHGDMMGDLVVRKESQRYSPNDPRYDEYVRNEE